MAHIVLVQPKIKTNKTGVVFKAALTPAHPKPEGT